MSFPFNFSLIPTITINNYEVDNTIVLNRLDNIDTKVTGLSTELNTIGVTASDNSSKLVEILDLLVNDKNKIIL